MKPCLVCKVEKPLEDFHKRTAARDGKQAVCKECNKSQRKQYYRTANGRAKHILSGRRWQERLKVRVADYLKEHPCIVCGEKDIQVLDFDHRDPSTKFESISVMTVRGYSWDRVLEEIQKCDVLCANDHRRRTAKQFGWKYK